MSFNWRDRQRDLASLGSSADFDLLIIGGGITGAAVARDAALRGARVLLVEKGDFAEGTSSRSSKLVHGGVRYLEHGEFGLVAESTRERALLWRLAPELVQPLAFLFPAFRHSRVPLWKLDLGLWLYDLLAAFRTPSLHRKYSAQKTRELEPYLEKPDLTGSIFYWDGSTNDALLTLATILDAQALGAKCLSRTAFRSVEWAADKEAPHRVSLEDTLTGQRFEARARVIISAAGPWTDSLGLVRRPRQLLATTRGSHIVVPAAKLPLKHAIVLIHPTDQRVLFAIPWGEATVLGTTDIFDRESPDRTRIDSREIDYLIRAGNDFFPRAKLERGDVLSTWSGLRPLLAPPDSADASAISREHHIEWIEPGLLIVAGGKLTTHREMAEQVLDRISLETRAWRRSFNARLFESGLTKTRPLPTLGTLAVANTPRLGVSEASALTEAQLRRICREQMVLSLEDLFVRRTDIFYKEKSNGLELLPKLESLLCAELGWSKNDWGHAIAAYRDYVARNVTEPLAT